MRDVALAIRITLFFVDLRYSCAGVVQHRREMYSHSKSLVTKGGVNIDRLNDEDLVCHLQEMGLVVVGPITDETRPVYKQKLLGDQ